MRPAFILCALSALGAPSALAQAPATCTVQLDSVGGVWASCRGRPTRMRADSAAFYSERDKVDFIGHVRFHDSTVTLESQTASYFVRDERLEAYGAVHLVNLETGSQLDGPAL